MTSKDKLKCICNYQEKTSTLPQMQVMYIDMVSSDEEYQLELKRLKRELVIDITLGNKDESEFNELESVGSNGYPTISPNLSNIIISASKFIDYDDIYDKVIHLVDNKTQNPKTTMSNFGNNSLSVKLSNTSDDFDTISRRILTMLNLHSNIIAMDGRIGSSNTAIIGNNLFKYISYIENIYGYKQLDIIYDTSIDPDKIILCRNDRNNGNSQGIFLINDIQNSHYFLKETNKWDRQFSWFWVK